MLNRQSPTLRILAALTLIACLTGWAATQIDWKTQIKNMPAGFAALSSATPMLNDVLTYNGSTWVAQAGGGGSTLPSITAQLEYLRSVANSGNLTSKE